MRTKKEPIGLTKKSFSMFFGGGEIWFEHLDALFGHSNLAIEKLEKDYLEFKRPSVPSLMAINLDETEVDEKLISAITNKLLNGEKRLTRVVFVGLNLKNRYKIKRQLQSAPFAYTFINDFEKAKEWLVRE